MGRVRDGRWEQAKGGFFFFLKAVDQGGGREDGAKCQVTLKGASGPAASV